MIVSLPRRTGSALAALALLVTALSAVASPARAATESASCGSLANVTRTTAGYASSLDANQDLVACEDATTLARPVMVGTGCSTDAAATLLFGRINEFRAQNGLRPLLRTCSVEVTAQRWSDGMAQRATMSHNPLLAQQVPAGWQKVGENVAWSPIASGNAATADRLFTLWLNSAPHRAAMLDASYTRAGIGVSYGSGDAWATLDLARY